MTQNDIFAQRAQAFDYLRKKVRPSSKRKADREAERLLEAHHDKDAETIVCKYLSLRKQERNYQQEGLQRIMCDSFGRVELLKYHINQSWEEIFQKLLDCDNVRLKMNQSTLQDLEDTRLSPEEYYADCVKYIRCAAEVYEKYTRPRRVDQLLNEAKKWN